MVEAVGKGRAAAVLCWSRAFDTISHKLFTEEPLKFNKSHRGVLHLGWNNPGYQHRLGFIWLRKGSTSRNGSGGPRGQQVMSQQYGLAAKASMSVLVRNVDIFLFPCVHCKCNCLCRLIWGQLTALVINPVQESHPPPVSDVCVTSGGILCLILAFPVQEGCCWHAEESPGGQQGCQEPETQWMRKSWVSWTCSALRKCFSETPLVVYNSCYPERLWNLHHWRCTRPL